MLQTSKWKSEISKGVFSTGYSVNEKRQPVSQPPLCSSSVGHFVGGFVTMTTPDFGDADNSDDAPYTSVQLPCPTTALCISVPVL